MSENLTCIIGAGSSGMVAAKVLKSRGIAFDCFEMGSDLGGLWRYGNDNGRSAAYQSLHINSSRQEMAFSDFPMPSDYPDFPHHSQICSYFESYANHFQLRPHIQFRTQVERVECDSGGFRVTVVQDGQRTTRWYREVIVANGHHWCPHVAKFPGTFSGESLHTHDYKTPAGLEGKRVLVIGMGNSACDIASEISRCADKVFLSTRRGAHIIPKYLLGKPLDRICPPALWNHLPLGVLQRIFSAAMYIARGRVSRFGLPQPQHKILEEHPTVSSDLLNLIGHGKIHIKKNVQQFDGTRVQFEDGSVENIDTIIYATGYQIRFPFLDETLFSAADNQVRLYRNVVDPNIENLFFVGLVQPWGPLMPLAELQSEWLGDLISGVGTLPSPDAMNAEIERNLKKQSKRYISSKRHTIQVDFHPYRALLNRERKLGLKRANAKVAGGLTHRHSLTLPSDSKQPRENITGLDPNSNSRAA